MGASNLDGPIFTYGPLAALLAAYGDAVPDYNLDAGPSFTFQGDALFDVRFPFLKDKVEGYTGVVPGHANHVYVCTSDQIPAAFSASNIAAAANVATGVAMTLATATATGIAPNIPVRLQTAGAYVLNPGTIQNALALDFGFAFANCTAGNATVTVADATQFINGEPLVIAGVGNAGGTAPLLTYVSSGAGVIGGTSIVLGNAPLASNAAAAIGTGNYWGPSPTGFPGQPNGTPLPDAALPYLGAGPGLLLDPRQCITRALSITGVTGGTGGAFACIGIDLYGNLFHETITHAGGATTKFGKKTYKYVVSVTPQFTDAHNYSVGTSDVFGSHIRADKWEYQNIFWGGQFDSQTQANSGWLAADLTNPATATTGDVRGTFQSSTNGGGTGETGGSASNGTISSLAMSGNRLAWFMTLSLYNLLNAFPATPQYLYGMSQF